MICDECDKKEPEGVGANIHSDSAVPTASVDGSLPESPKSTKENLCPDCHSPLRPLSDVHGYCETCLAKVYFETGQIDGTETDIGKPYDVNYGVVEKPQEREDD